ncbi:MAG: DUF2298 domain-containing protein [Anaerolineaceae bacterium]|nr:DUF2298 domain-containing protein [Anaerolineaceae bacterium]
MVYIILWYLFVVVIGWMVFPLTFQLFQRLPDRGITITKIFGILLISFFHWFLTSLGLSSNTLAGIWFAIFLSLGLGLWSLSKFGSSETRKWTRDKLGFFLVVELVFLIAFVGMIWLRSYNPDIQGTEKPMELMFINSILNSPTFPPQDAWLSGFSISYYYFGYVMVALLAMITGTPAGIAFNLAISLIFALAFTGAFGVLLNLIAKMQDHESDDFPNLSKFVPISLIAPIILLFVGNFYGILDVLHKHRIFADLNVPAVWFETGKIDANTQAVIEPRVISGRINFWEWMDLKQLGPISPQAVPFQGIQQDNWFFASRTIHDRNLMGYDPEAIDEFPAFSFLLADLHPHVLGLPFVLLVILLCFEWLLDLRARKEDDNPPSITWERIGFSAIILGSLIFMNTWDFPFYIFLFLFCGVLAYFYMRDEKLNWKTLLIFLRPMGWVILVGVLVYLPFLVSLQSQAGGIIPNAIYPTKFRQLFVMFGPLILGIVLLLVTVIRQYKPEIDYKVAWKITLGFLVFMVMVTSTLVVLMLMKPEMSWVVNDAISPFAIKDAFGWLLIRRLVEGGTLLLGLLLLAGVIAVLWGLRRQGSESILFVVAMMLTGVLLLLGPEFVYLRDNFGWRMNTLFKFYFQIWILWALSAGFGFWYLLKRTKGWGRTVGAILMAVGFLLGAVYTLGTIQTTTSAMRQSVISLGIRQPTLDGLAYYQLYHPEDWSLVEWFNINVNEPAVVLEGTKGAYWIEGRSSRISMMTGLPTVMGWVNHEAQWRGKYFSNVATRENDIRIIYMDRDWYTTEELLNQYDITYVVVSPLEREWYGAIQQSKFDQNMQKVFELGDYVIYQR